jgi:Arc/MetJ-type ribon-helix-helix transcriptional regulator
MAAPTVGFSIGRQDQDRVQRLAARYAHGNRSAWLRQAIDLFEEKALFDTLVAVQARGDRLTAQQGIDRAVLAGLVSEAAADPDSRHAQRVASIIEQFTGGAELDELEADHEATEAFMAAAGAGSPEATGA